jgi:flavin-dependent dehydrogenase
VSGPDAVVVGGGPAGAIAGALLARRGHDVILVDRSPAWRWHACGVFTSPAAVTALQRAGLDEATLNSVKRPIPAMRVEVVGGETFRLTYGDDGSLSHPAVGFDRQALDLALLRMAEQAGVEVRRGTALTELELEPGRVRVRIREPLGTGSLMTRAVIGADGVRSTVARQMGVNRPPRLGKRVGLTFHVTDPRPAADRDARMVILDGAYCGLAPVPGNRVNVGIVLASRAWRRRLSGEGAAAVAGAVLREIPTADDDPVDWAAAERLDAIEGASPLGHRVAQRAGAGWLLVGDAAGFLDPLTGEGLHRAIISAALAAKAVDALLGGRTDAPAAYERAMTRRFRSKDVVTHLIQSFLDQPVLMRRASANLAQSESLRATMGLVIGDLAPPTRALEPSFLARLLL